jgi:hypothetical protein
MNAIGKQKVVEANDVISQEIMRKTTMEIGQISLRAKTTMLRTVMVKMMTTLWLRIAMTTQTTKNKKRGKLLYQEKNDRGLLTGGEK